AASVPLPAAASVPLPAAASPPAEHGKRQSPAPAASKRTAARRAAGEAPPPPPPPPQAAAAPPPAAPREETPPRHTAARYACSDECVPAADFSAATWPRGADALRTLLGRAGEREFFSARP